MTQKNSIVTQNKKARHDYFIEQSYEAGINLRGTEVKSIREGKVSVNDAYVQIKHGEIFIINMHVSPYTHGNLFNHEETRTRKLLMHKKEILKIEAKIKEDGYTVIPLKVYFVEGLVKVEIAIAKGKKLFDKRESLKEEDAKKHMKKTLKEAFRRES
jgi:SsrA-binding protein